MIVFDVSPAVHNKAGLGRYAAELLGALVFDNPGRAPADAGITALYHDAASAKPDALVQSLPRIAIAQRPYPWRLRALLAQIANLSQDALLGIPAARGGASQTGATLFHATEHLLPRFKRARTVFTLHDLIFKHFPQYHLPRNRAYLQLAMPIFLRRADAIICVSEHTKRDAMRIYRVPETKMRVIHEGVHPRFARVTDKKLLDIAREQYSLPERFILSLGTIEPRKNYVTLIKAFAEYRRRTQDVSTPLIIVGRQGWLFHETFRAVHENGLTGHVRFLQNVADTHLPAMYSLATVFAMASYYEGFGFTPLEALACGAPVLCSNAASLPEVVCEAGLLLPPGDVAAWAGALERALTDPAWRAALAARGPAQAARFNWQTAARETRAVYGSL